MRYEYRTRGVCSQMIVFDLDGDVVSNMEVIGGCNGNLKGICSLVEGMTVEQIHERLAGIRCGMKPTSCPDQIAQAVRLALDSATATASANG